jgi:hypothetical protein
MAPSNETEKLWLRDEQGNYYMLTPEYVLTPELLESVKVPAEHKSEVEKVLHGQDDTVGYMAFGIPASQISVGGSRLSVIGRCRCAWHFGVQAALRR